MLMPHSNMVEIGTNLKSPASQLFVSHVASSSLIPMIHPRFFDNLQVHTRGSSNIPYILLYVFIIYPYLSLFHLIYPVIVRLVDPWIVFLMSFFIMVYMAKMMYFLYGGFHSHRDSPIAGWFIRENPNLETDDLGVPPCMETPV